MKVQKPYRTKTARKSARKSARKNCKEKQQKEKEENNSQPMYNIEDDNQQVTTSK